MLFLFGLVGKNDDFVTAHLHITAFNGKFLEGAAFVFLDANNAVRERRDQGHMVVEETHFAFGSGHHDEVDLVGVELRLRRHDIAGQSSSSLIASSFFMASYSAYTVVDATLQAEALLRNLVALAVENGSEGTNGVFHLDVLAPAGP